LVVARPDDRETLEVIRANADFVDLAEVTTPGHVAPIRVAVETVSSPVTMIIDDDARPLATDWVANLYTAITAPNVGVVGSGVVEDNVVRRVRKNSGRVAWYGQAIANVAGRSDAAPTKVDCLPEGNWAWRTPLLKSLTISPIFDSGDAVMYGLDLCLQAKSRGWEVQFVPSAPIEHYSAPRLGAPPRDDKNAAVFSYARNMTYIALSRYGLRCVPFFVWSTLLGDSAMYGLLSFVRDVVRRRARPSAGIYAIRGRIAGVSTWRHERVAGRL
jgi:GT2 family glycosyltransferase